MSHSNGRGLWSKLIMRGSTSEYLALKLRAHELLRDFELYDVSVVNLPGGGESRRVADIRALERIRGTGRIATVIYSMRRCLGRMFGWDRRRLRPEDSLVERLSDPDRRDSEVPPGTPEGEFIILYRFPGEELREIFNRTVHGLICTALIRAGSDEYRLYWGVYVQRVSWLTRPYLLAIEPFRWILYPAILRRTRRNWIAAYGAASGRRHQ